MFEPKPISRDAMTAARAEGIPPARNHDGVRRGKACGRPLHELPDIELADIQEHPIQSE